MGGWGSWGRGYGLTWVKYRKELITETFRNTTPLLGAFFIENMVFYEPLAKLSTDQRVFFFTALLGAPLVKYNINL